MNDVSQHRTVPHKPNMHCADCSHCINRDHQQIQLTNQHHALFAVFKYVFCYIDDLLMLCVGWTADSPPPPYRMLNSSAAVTNNNGQSCAAMDVDNITTGHESQLAAGVPTGLSVVLVSLIYMYYLLKSTSSVCCIF